MWIKIFKNSFLVNFSCRLTLSPHYFDQHICWSYVMIFKKSLNSAGNKTGIWSCNHKSETVINVGAWYVGGNVLLFRENDQISQKDKSIVQSNKLWLDTWSEMWSQCEFSHFHKKTFNTFGKEKTDGSTRMFGSWSIFLKRSRKK